MKKESLRIILIGILEAAIILIAAIHQSNALPSDIRLASTGTTLQQQAFAILDQKCNTCHRRMNPLMVFKEKNMNKRAPKIQKAVFIDRKMPLGNQVRLTAKEYQTLKDWLSTQNL